MPEIDLIKAPPQDLAAEQAVLGAVFLDSERYYPNCSQKCLIFDDSVVLIERGK